MPRPNQPRALTEEDNLARRIAYEREQRTWSYDGLAERMTRAGCPIHASALYKVEKGNPRRRIAVVELVALSKVFEVGVSELLLPPEIVADRHAQALIARWHEANAAIDAAMEERDRVWQLLTDHLATNPASADAVRAYVTETMGRDPKSADAFLSIASDKNPYRVLNPLNPTTTGKKRGK